MKLLSSLFLGLSLGVSMQVVMAAPLPLVVQHSQTKIAIEKCLNGKKNCVSIKASYPVTNVEWINKAIENRMKSYASKDDQSNATTTQQAYENLVKESYQSMKNIFAEYPESSGSVEYYKTIALVYQKGPWVIFKDDSRSYFEWDDDFLINHDVIIYDLNKQKPLMLQDMLKPNSQKKLTALLKETYKYQYPEDYEANYAGRPKSAMPDNELFMTDDFAFTSDGIRFYYPSFPLSSDLGVGYIYIDLTNDDLKDIIKPEYLQ